MWATHRCNPVIRGLELGCIQDISGYVILQKTVLHGLTDILTAHDWQLSWLTLFLYLFPGLPQFLYTIDDTLLYPLDIMPALGVVWGP